MIDETFKADFSSASSRGHSINRKTFLVTTLRDIKSDNADMNNQYGSDIEQMTETLARLNLKEQHRILDE